MSLIANITKLVKPKVVCGVFVTVTPDEKYDIAAIQVRRSGKVVEIKSFKEGIKSFGELRSWLKFNYPISLSYAGKGFLAKTVSGAAGYEPAQLTQIVLPDARKEDFYADYQIPQSPNEYLVCIARKMRLEKLICDAEEAKLHVVQVKLGPQSLNGLLDYLSNSVLETTYYKAGEFRVGLNEAGVESFDSHKDDNALPGIQIGDEEIEGRMLLPYANAIEIFLNQGTTDARKLATNKYQEFLYFKLFQHSWKIVLGSFFLILMVNFFIYNNAYSENQSLQNQFESNKALLTESENLEQQIDTRLQFLGNQGWLNTPKSYHLADIIAHSVPNEVMLTGMDIFPQQNDKRGTNKRRQFDVSAVRLEGLSPTSQPVNILLSALDQVEVFTDIKLEDYTQKTVETDGAFSVIIDLKKQ